MSPQAHARPGLPCRASAACVGAGFGDHGFGAIGAGARGDGDREGKSEPERSMTAKHGAPN